jgi:hypothetical protein
MPKEEEPCEVFRILKGARGVLMESAVEVGVDEEEEDHAEGHEICVNTEDDASVIEVPAALDTTDGIDSAKTGEGGENSDERIGTAVGEAGERY